VLNSNVVCEERRQEFTTVAFPRFWRSKKASFKMPNPERPGGDITAVRMEGAPARNLRRSLVLCPNPRQLQEGINK
jgi:hypothetical protein